MKKILCTVFGIVAFASTSFAQFNPNYEYGCQIPDDYDSLRLYVGHQDVPQQPGRYVFAFTVRKLNTSVFPAQTEYPQTAVLFHNFGSLTAPTPFAGGLLCLDKQFAIPIKWTPDKGLFQSPVYLLAIEQSSLQATPITFQAWMRNQGGFELSNAITISL